MIEETPFIKFSKTYPEWDGHIAFSEETCIKWRNKFSVSSHWKAHPEFGEDSRGLLKTLVPPFYPEDEFLIWDPGIGQLGSTSTVYISKVISHQLSIDEGLCFGTDFRMIWGNRFTGLVAQLLYKEIKALEKNQNSLRIFAENERTFEIVFSTVGNLGGDSKFVDPSSFSPFNLLFEFFQSISNHNDEKMQT